MGNSNCYIKHDVKVVDAFIEKFAQRYIDQRRQAKSDLSEVNNSQLYRNHGFDSSLLQDIISKNSVAKDFVREQGQTPKVLRDIYRSDLGELLMTYYFEEKLDENQRYVIPIKNITYREREDMPGRGLDAIGYKTDGQSIAILLGEAKVSAQPKSPPEVVDKTKDSIYNTQKSYNDDLSKVVRRLSDYCKRLDIKDAEIIGLAILDIETQSLNICSITFGCTLIRDYSCVDENRDYGKMKTDADSFQPNKIHFSILSFTEKEIESTVQLFYEKVQELIQ